MYDMKFESIDKSLLTKITIYNCVQAQYIKYTKNKKMLSSIFKSKLFYLFNTHSNNE